MSEVEEKETKSLAKSLFIWIIIFPPAVNLFIHLTEIISRIVSDFQSGNEFVLSNILLGFSPDWNFFLEIKLEIFAISVLLGFLAWIYSNFISKD